MSEPTTPMGHSERGPIQLPGRECRCESDGQTFLDTSACPVHDTSTSPLAKQIDEHWEEGIKASLRAENDRLREGLRRWLAAPFPQDGALDGEWWDARDNAAKLIAESDE